MDEADMQNHHAMEYQRLTGEMPTQIEEESS
jgi:hypothetical protein